jgi:alpha-mannosidase
MSTIRDLLIVHHSHTDIGYTNYQDSVFALHREYLRRALDLAERYADGAEGERFRWTNETTILTEDFLRHATSRDVDRLLDLHHKGLIDFGGMYCNWTPLATTEIMARSLMVAGKLRREHGLDIRYGLNCDVNGQSWGLVELLLDAGFDGFGMAINRVMARDPQPRPRGFRWAGPSGRTLLVWHGEHYGWGHMFGIPRVDTPAGWKYDLDQAYPLLQAYVQQQVERGYPYDFLYFQITSTFMWDNGAPHEELVRFVREWNGRGWQPRLQLISLAELFERLAQQPDLPTYSGDWVDWWSHGVASSAYETALNRQNQARYFSGLALGALLQGQPQPSPVVEEEPAWRALALYDEHTWGSYDSLQYASSHNARGQRYRKALYAYEGAAAVTRLVQSVHRDLSARLPQPDTPHVCVFNPLPWARRVPLMLPAVGPSGWENAQLERSLELSSPQSEWAARIDYGIVDLPPCGYVTLPLRLSEPPPANEERHKTAEQMGLIPEPAFVPQIAPGLSATAGVRAESWTLENDFYRLHVDSTTGAIDSLIGKVDGKEWVADTTPWRLGHYIYETDASPRGRQDMQMRFAPGPDFDRQADLAPQRAEPDGVQDMRFVRGVGQGRFALRLDVPGASCLSVQIVLYDDLPWIDLIYDVDKIAVTDMESIYIAFPFALNQPVASYETAGAIVQAEAQQIPYGSRDFYSIQHWVDLTDGQRGMTVASPDAPIIHLGGFTNHKYLSQMQMEQPFLLSWPINNHWFTNFPASQQGWMRFRYRLLPHAAPFDPVAATRFGAEAAIEPLCGPVWDRPAGLERRAFPFAPHLPQQASFLTVEPGNVHLVGLKPAADGRGIIVRLQELSGQESDFQLLFSTRQVLSVERCDLLETAEGTEGLAVADNRITGRIESHRLLTLRVGLRG